MDRDREREEKHGRKCSRQNEEERTERIEKCSEKRSVKGIPQERGSSRKGTNLDVFLLSCSLAGSLPSTKKSENVAAEGMEQ